MPLCQDKKMKSQQFFLQLTLRVEWRGIKFRVKMTLNSAVSLWIKQMMDPNFPLRTLGNCSKNVIHYKTPPRYGIIIINT